MGELILCNQMLAEVPYYVSRASLNVYSLEELSYYIEHNVYLLEEDFMSEELCDWMEQELGLKKAAERLRELCKRKATMAEFVTVILQESGYCSSSQAAQIVEILTELENKSEYECTKMRADRYVANKRYISGIYEYRRLLEMDDCPNEGILGNVWHNLGKAYAGLFLFEEAANCFWTAYTHNQNMESLKECFFACRCMGDEKRFDEIVSEDVITDEMRLDFSGEFAERSRVEDIRQFEMQLEEWFAAGKLAEAGRLVEEWKDTYRKNCRI